MITGSLSSLGKGYDYLHHLGVKKMQMYFSVSQTQYENDLNPHGCQDMVTVLGYDCNIYWGPYHVTREACVGPFILANHETCWHSQQGMKWIDGHQSTGTDSMVNIPTASMKLKGGYTGFNLSICLAVHLWTESCPLCIFNNTRRIHFIFAHLIKQLQKVCRMSCLFQNYKYLKFWQIL